MIDARLHRADGLLTIEPRGALEKADFERLCLLVDHYIEERGRLDGVLIFSDSFTGWESLGAMLSHLRFVNDHQDRIARVAVLGDHVSILPLLQRLGDWFTGAEVRRFAFEDRAAAEAWLRGEAD